MMDSKNKSDPPKNIKERLYDHIHLPLWVLDVIIWLCVWLAVFFVVYGTIQGNR